MSLKRTVSSGNSEEFEQPPAGTHLAVCVAVVVTGTHAEEYKGVAKEVEKIFLAWELLGEVMPGTKNNWVVGREYTLSLNAKANLRKLIDAWKTPPPLADGDDFDLARLAGQPCQVTLTETQPNAEGRTYRNVVGVTRKTKDQAAGKAQRPPFVYDAIDLAAGPAGLAALPDWLPRIYGQTVADRIKDSNEWRGGAAAGPAPTAAATLPDMDPNAYDVF
jgi:hypothetical protein